VRDDRAYLAPIAENIDLILGWLAGPTGAPDRRTFYEDLLRQRAVLRNLETLADAASHFSDALKARHPWLPWRKVADFRNVLAHVYLELDLDLVWQTIANDLPELKAIVDEELGR